MERKKRIRSVLIGPANGSIRPEPDVRCKVPKDYFRLILLKNSKFQDERNRRSCPLNGQCKEWDIHESIYRGRGSNLVGSIWSTLTEKLDGL